MHVRAGKYKSQRRIPLHSLLQTTVNIGLYVIAYKTDFKCFKQLEVISALRGKLLKLVDKFTYLRSNISSTERDINMNLSKPRMLLTDYRSYGNLTSMTN